MELISNLARGYPTLPRLKLDKKPVKVYLWINCSPRPPAVCWNPLLGNCHGACFNKCCLQLAAKPEDRFLLSWWDVYLMSDQDHRCVLEITWKLCTTIFVNVGMKFGPNFSLELGKGHKFLMDVVSQAISGFVQAIVLPCKCFVCFLCKEQQWHGAQWWRLRIQSENLHKDERSYQQEVSLLNYTFQWIRTKLKNVVDIRSLGWLLKRSIFQHVNSSLSTWLYLTLSPVSILSAEIGNLCHMVSASPEGQ